jgi:hypothetical protein
MNKALYIVGIVFSVIFLILTFGYAEEVSNARYSSYFYDYNYYDYGSSASDLTMSAALWSLFFFLSFITIDLLGLIKVKTKTTKVLSIIGLSLSGMFLLWNFAVLSSPGSLSFDEVSPAWVFYCLAMLAFTIIGLIQSIRFGRKASAVEANQPVSTEPKDLLDS